MGIVYKVYDFERSEICAIKVLRAEMASDPALRARLDREAEVMASIQHPNILPVYGTATVSGLPCIVMKYVFGGELRFYLDRTLDAATVLLLFRQACAGVDKAHKGKIYHRDLKPANLLVEQRSEGWHLYVADFSVAIGAGQHGTRYTAHGYPVGTDKFIPPEAADGDIAGVRGDVYSLGRCLQLMVGIHNCVGPIDAVVTRATAPLPGDRHADAIELYEEAAEALTPLGTQPLPPSPERDPDKTRLDTAATRALSLSRASRTPVVDRGLAAVGLGGLAVNSCLTRSRARPRELTVVLSTDQPAPLQGSGDALMEWLASELDVDQVEVVVLPNTEDPRRLVRAFLSTRFTQHALPRDFDSLRARWQGNLLEIELTPRLDRLCDQESLAPLALFMGAEKVQLKPITTDPGR